MVLKEIVEFEEATKKAIEALREYKIPESSISYVLYIKILDIHEKMEVKKNERVKNTRRNKT